MNLIKDWKMNIVTVAKDNSEIVEVFIHHLYRSTDMRKHTLSVCDNSTDPKHIEKIRKLQLSGWITLLTNTSNAYGQGSRNHRLGLMSAMRIAQRCSSTNNVAIFDIDAFPLTYGWDAVVEEVLETQDMFGFRHNTKKYMHPSILFGKYRTILEILSDEHHGIDNGKYTDIDCFETSKHMKFAEEISYGQAHVESKTYQIGVQYHYRHIAFFHSWYYTRTNGLTKPCDDLEQYDLTMAKEYFEHDYNNDLCVIIPCYGKTDGDTLEQVTNGFNNQSYKDFDVNLCAYDHESFDEVRKIKHCMVNMVGELDNWSRAKAFNRAVAMLPKYKYYIFHDRDIMIPKNFIEDIHNRLVPDKQFYMVNYAHIMKDGHAESKSVGGSCTISWDAMYFANGMCSDMDHWGAEDRDFDNRLKVLLGVENSEKLQHTLIHINHKPYPIRPEINQKLKLANASYDSYDVLIKNRYLHNDYEWYWNQMNRVV
jgi:hypothetical protein